MTAPTPLTQSLLTQLSGMPDGRLSFAVVMEQALYHPECGYYGPGPRRLGRAGDFYTAVSVGPLYGQLLAALARTVWEEKGSPANFTVIEQGAHDGQLAMDILHAVENEHFEHSWRYIIVEPNPAYQKVQKERLAGKWGDRVAWVEKLTDLREGAAFFLCNELPDAMPVHLVRWTGGQWVELWVRSASNMASLEFCEGPLSSDALAAETARLPDDLPEGYTTEISLAAIQWVQDLARAPFSGAIFVADYGFDAAELYAPERITGTLRRFFDHQTDDHVLENLGACDLTTHINFTRLSEEAASHGMHVRTYEHQGRFLGKLGLPWLATLEGRPPDAAAKALLRQYQSLTHPGFMGRSFRVLLLDKS